MEALIEVMPQVLQNIADAKLIIIGSGPLYSFLKEKIKTMRLEEEVRLVGQVPQEELLSLLRAGDIFLLNTAYEGFSHTLLEAMAMGIPIITTRAGGNQEVMKDDVNGLLVGYNNKEELKYTMVRLALDGVLRKHLAENAQKSLEMFTRGKMVHDTIGVITSL